MIQLNKVTKVFGDDPDLALNLLDDGKTKDEIFESTGQVVGVSNVNFELDEGEIFCIMGLSGSGKSTLLRCVNRLIEPTRGQVFMNENGENVEITSLGDKELRDIRTHKMSMVFQHFGLFPHRTVMENTIYGLEIQGQDATESLKIGQEVLAMVGLEQWGDSKISQLSGGMQQRVGLARALATDAKVLLMDEPFSALDPLIKVQMQNELIQIQQKLKRTMLFITHDLDEALKLGSHIAIMDAGEIIQIGTPEDIIVNPRTEYVADFVEHADSTGVITAGTICINMNGRLFQAFGDKNDLRFFGRKGDDSIQFGIDHQGKLCDVHVEGKSVNIRSLNESVDEDMDVPDLRRRDVVLTCTADTPLREVIRGRLLTQLPVVVLTPEKTFKGIVGEREFVKAILEKRGADSSDEDRGS